MSPRLTKDERRAQLLDTAHAIIRREGTDALTLAHLAEEAGVSKPIAYNHFGTRQGLLRALFESFDERQIAAMKAALADAQDTLEATAEVAAAGYIRCVVGTGPEYEEMSAALLAYDETKDVLRTSRAAFENAYREAFAPFVAVDGPTLTALVGAAEALSREVNDDRLDEPTAIRTLAHLMRAALRLG